MKSLLVFPDGLHFLGVVVHVALQPDALWGTLQHQLRGRSACKHATQLHMAAPPGVVPGSAGPLTGDLSDSVDDVVKHCGQKTEMLLLVVNKGRLGSGEKVPWPEMSNVEVSLPLSSPSTAL